MGEVDEVIERYVMVYAQLRLSRSIGVGERYVSQHPFTSEMSEVDVHGRPRQRIKPST